LFHNALSPGNAIKSRVAIIATKLSLTFLTYHGSEFTCVRDSFNEYR
jgi:hypothetical protein